MPELVTVVPDETIFSDHINDLRDRTVQRYSDATERGSLHGSPVAGDLSYLESDDGVYVWSGTAWVAPVGPMGITTPRIVDGAVTTAKLVNASVTAAKLYGSSVAAFEIEAHSTSVAAISLTTTRTNKHGIGLTIPADWNTYNVHALANGTFHSDQGSLLHWFGEVAVVYGDGTGPGDDVGVEYRFSGLEQSSDLYHPYSVQHFANGLTETGAITIGLFAWENNSASATSLETRSLYARARRTS